MDVFTLLLSLESLDRNIIRAEAFGDDDIAGHKTEFVRSLSGNTYSSGYDWSKTDMEQMALSTSNMKKLIHQNRKATAPFFIISVLLSVYLTEPLNGGILSCLVQNLLWNALTLHS